MESGASRAPSVAARTAGITCKVARCRRRAGHFASLPGRRVTSRASRRRWRSSTGWPSRSASHTASSATELAELVRFVEDRRDGTLVMLKESGQRDRRSTPPPPTDQRSALATAFQAHPASPPLPSDRGGVVYSHSMVPGGLDVTSSTTRLTPGTSAMMRFESCSTSSYGRRAQSAVIASSLVTARMTIG